MRFDYPKFSKKVHSNFKEHLALDEVDKILSLPEGYGRDDPVSSGKRLRLDKIFFSGDKGDGNSFEYSRKFDDGVNMWVADNLKGKSTVFKLIKFALTGKDSLKPDIRKWIDRVFLGFSIGGNEFSVLLELNKPRPHGILYSTDVESIKRNDFSQSNIVFEAKDNTSFTTQIESFFFNQFSFYSLKWTQKHSAKDSNDLVEAGSSWRTYYKAIYLESKDVDKLFFGSQNELIFQMLLGLDLTYPINRLKVKRDMTQHEIAISKIRNSALLDGDSIVNVSAGALIDELTEINKKIKLAKKDMELTVSTSRLWDEHAGLTTRIAEKYTVINNVRAELKRKNKELDTSYTGVEDAGEEKDGLKNQIQKNNKKILDLQEYLELGVFFSNLDIRTCPHCDHEISEESRKNEKMTHECSLCSSDLNDIEVDGEYYAQKIEDLQVENAKYEQHIKMLNSKEVANNRDAEDVKEKINKLMAELSNAEADDGLVQQLGDIELRLKAADKDRQEVESQLSELLVEKGIIEYRIRNEQKESASEDNLTDIQADEKAVEVLEEGIRVLEQQRFKNNEQILIDLQSLIIGELHSIGLESFSDVRITDKFRLVFTQHGDELAFSDITEGEQLRVKLAFYLGLIQMDVKYNVGRHPKLLIIDTPAKEEGDKHYLEGLSEMLSSIDEKYGEGAQIFVGTASRELISPNLSDKTEVTDVDKYVF